MGIKIKELQDKLSKMLNDVKNSFNFDPTSNAGNNFWTSPMGNLAVKAQEGVERLNQTKRIELPKPQFNNHIAQTATNIAYGIPESIINTPRNIVVGGSRIGTELGQSFAQKRPINVQNLVGGIAPMAEGYFDVATMGFINPAKNIAKTAAKEAVKKSFIKIAKQGASKGAAMGGAGGLTYGLDTQYGKKFDTGEVLTSTLAGTVLGGLLGGGIASLGTIKGLITRPKQLDQQLRDEAGRWVAGQTPIKPKMMPEPQWKFQLGFNKRYGRNPYTPVYPDDLQAAIKYEAKKRTGLQARDVNLDKNPLSTSNPTASNTDQVMAGGSSGNLKLKMPSQSGTAIRTTASQGVSSTNLTPKGQLNLNRLKIGGAGKKVLLKQEAKVEPTVIGNKEVVAQARTAKGTGAMTDDQMKRLMAQQLKNRQLVVDLTKKFNQAKKNGASEMELGKIMLEMANQSRSARQGGTFAGRLLQAQNIIADQSASPMQKILALLDNAGVSEEKYLKDSVRVNWDNPAEVVSFYRKYVPPTFGEVLDEVRYTNMLSSPLTHVINLSSNALQTAVVTPIEKTITGMLDFGKTVLTGKERQYYASSGLNYAGGYIKSLPTAFKKAWGIISGKDISIRPDYEQIPTGVGGALKAYSTPLRLLEAGDQFFRTLVEGGVTNELKNAPRKLSQEAIADKASKEANYRLFRQAFDPNGQLGQGVVLQFFDKWNSAIGNMRRLPGGKWVLPFLQTPTNILKQGVEYSPLGISTMVGAKNPIEQLSKTIIGTGVFLGVYQLAKNGLVSWEAPSSETERELYYAAGMQPYSVKIGNEWVSFSKLGPLAYPMAMAAALADAERRQPDESAINNISSGLGGILGFFGDQSYVRSIGDLVDAIQGGVNIKKNAMEAEAANLAGQLVPYKSFLTWIGRMIDPVYRKASTFEDRMKKDLPIVGDDLEPYTDPEGNPSVRSHPYINAVSPLKVSQEKGEQKELYDQYESAKIQRGIDKRADEKFMSGKGEQTGRVYRYVDNDGKLQKIELGWTPPELKLTGNIELDKKLKSKYSSAITSRANNLVKLYELGVITEQEAESELEKLTKLKDKSSGSGSKKIKLAAPPKIKSVSIKAPSKMPAVNFSMSTPKLNLTPTKRRNASSVKLKKLSSPTIKIKRSYYNPQVLK